MKNGTATNLETTTTFSAYQLAVFADVENGTGHTAVLAYAGSGKTTTIVEALRRVPRGLTVLMVAFNTSIKDELKKRAPAGVEVKTVHSHGFATVRKAFKNVRVDNFKTFSIFEALYGAEDVDGAAVAKIVGVAKDTLAAMADAARLAEVAKGARFRAITLDTLAEVEAAVAGADYEDALESLDAIVDAFGVDMPETADDDDLRTEEDVRADVVKKALVILARSMQVTAVIDFSDMCWLPVVWNLRPWQFDRVFIDETQDLSPCQIELVKRFVRRGGRILAVGDERQSIYQFRGADKDAIPGLVRSLGAKTLPLSITYRCPRAVVALANKEVPQLEAAPNAIDGSVDNASPDMLFKQAEPGDMIISRTNAPLIGICLRLLLSGKRAAIMGRNIGENIIKLIDKARAKTVEALETWIDAWALKESSRLARKNRDAQQVEDMKECVLALCREAETIADVKSKADELFSDREGEAKVTLGTTHKLKGLEADRVWMLESTYRRKNGGEEANLWYVAVTRAKRELRMTALPKVEA